MPKKKTIDRTSKCVPLDRLKQAQGIIEALTLKLDSADKRFENCQKRLNQVDTELNELKQSHRLLMRNHSQFVTSVGCAIGQTCLPPLADLLETLAKELPMALLNVRDQLKESSNV